MPVPLVSLPGTYDCIIEFTSVSDPTLKWRNTYTFDSVPVPNTFTGITAALGGFSVAMVRPDTIVSKISVYNWSRGRRPYPTGSPVFSQTFSTPGTADVFWAAALAPIYKAVGGEVCLRMDHETFGGGKPGRSFFRGLLGEGDVLASHSVAKWILVVLIAVLQTILDNLLSPANSNLAAYFGSGSGGQHLSVVRYSRVHGTVPAASPVAAFKLIGVTTNKRTRKNPH